MIDFNPIKKSDTVFIGDSLTEGFELVNHFHRGDLRNRGVSGSLTDHVIYRMEEVSNAKPHKVFLMIGINDLFSGQEPDDILNNIFRIIDHFMETSPQTTLFVQSVLPVNVSKLFEDEGINLKIYEINNQLESRCKSTKGVEFINLHHEFLGMTGQMDDRYSFDGVHLSPEGYKLWAQLLGKYLAD